VVYRGELVVEHAYSDQVMIKLLEANDPDRFTVRGWCPSTVGH
jgi:hypothetical protein